MGKGNCEFKGTGGQYFATVFIHLFLVSMVTFGIYSPWAFVRLLKLKASHTLLNGKRVTFTGAGGQLFVLILVQGLLTVITLGFYGPWAICKFLTWRAENTLVEDKSSQFTGTGSSLFVFYLIHFMILPALTLGLYYSLALYRLYAWKEENTRYGGEKTSFGAGFGEFFKVSLIGWILNSMTLNLFTPWSVCMLYKWQIQGLAVGDEEEVEHFPEVKTSIVASIVLIVIGLLILFAFIFILTTAVKKSSEVRSLEAQRLTQIDRMKIKRPQDGKGAMPLTKKPSAVTVQRPGVKPARELSKPQEATVPAPPAPDKKAAGYDREIKKLDVSIEKDSKNADAFYNRARLYAARGDLQQAQRDYSKALEINNKHDSAYYNRGLVYVRMEKYDLAVKDFDAAIRLEPSASDAYCNRGNANFQLGKNDSAIEDFTTALKIAPEDADLFHNRGIVYLSKGEKSKAMEDSKRAAQLREMKVEEDLKGKKGPGDKAGGVVWKQDLVNIKIPETIARGMIHGEPFAYESAKLENGVLTIRDGKDFFPDHAVKIFLFLKEGETAEGKSYNITRTSGFGSPHIHMEWKTKDSNIPKTEMFMQAYAMRLDLGTTENDSLPGKLYLCLPDKMKSFVAGSFTAVVK